MGTFLSEIKQNLCSNSLVWIKPIEDEKKRVGFISFRKIVLNKKGFNWSFYLDKNYQNKGLGRATAECAIKTLQKLDSNMPIFLTTEQNNELAQRLYIYLGFKKADFLDGDDLVFVYE